MSEVCLDSQLATRRLTLLRDNIRTRRVHLVKLLITSIHKERDFHKSEQAENIARLYSTRCSLYNLNGLTKSLFIDHHRIDASKLFLQFFLHFQSPSNGGNQLRSILMFSPSMHVNRTPPPHLQAELLRNKQWLFE